MELLRCQVYFNQQVLQTSLKSYQWMLQQETINKIFNRLFNLLIRFKSYSGISDLQFLKFLPSIEYSCYTIRSNSSVLQQFYCYQLKQSCYESCSFYDYNQYCASWVSYKTFVVLENYIYVDFLIQPSTLGKNPCIVLSSHVLIITSLSCS